MVPSGTEPSGAEPSGTEPSGAGLSPSIDAMREPVLQGQTRPLAWRLEQLQRLEALFEELPPRLGAALAADLGKPELEAGTEALILRQELHFTRRHLRRWMAPQRVGVPLPLLPGQAQVRPEPLGCVLILSPWNYPVLLCLRPLLSALAAGNTAVLKPSEHAPHSAALIAELVQRHLEPTVAQVVQGDAAVAARLLEEPFDHIFFTGSSRVGRLVMAAAARRPTPVTLELGGRNPAIVLADADLEVTARRLIWGRTINAGQTCVAPDHGLVQHEVLEPLAAALAAAIHRFYGADPLASPDLGRIATAGQFERLSALLAQARQRGQILAGGRTDAASRRIEPTLVAAEGEDDPLLQEEIFGPILPLLPVRDLGDALERLRRAPCPLALYLFSRSRTAVQTVLAGSRSGSVGVNEVVLQLMVPGLPFGGMGESGLGSYHGQAGFETFTHRRSVLQRPFQLDLPLRYPPYRGKLAWLQRLLG